MKFEFQIPDGELKQMVQQIVRDNVFATHNLKEEVRQAIRSLVVDELVETLKTEEGHRELGRIVQRNLYEMARGDDY